VGASGWTALRDWAKRLSVTNSAAIFAVVCGIFVADSVVARGPNVGSPFNILPDFSNSAPKANAPDAPDAPAQSAPARPRSAYVPGRTVCVRLCDGAFFPIAAPSSAAGEEAVCKNLCPDAPTAAYRQAEGSDKIDDAVSTAGRPYVALPAAFRYRTTLDRTCACHRSIAPHYSIAQDSTLRKGDYVMTPKGFLVFEGARRLPHGANDFTAIGNAKISRKERGALQAIEGPHAASGRAAIKITP
jgi:hypothetical protein